GRRRPAGRHRHPARPAGARPLDTGDRGAGDRSTKLGPKSVPI
ncbi:MAG: hypothetical protein AVDCRST_MAG59-4163, partial [uncultured Thermomicrobiales bacterium]